MLNRRRALKISLAAAVGSISLTCGARAQHKDLDWPSKAIRIMAAPRSTSTHASREVSTAECRNRESSARNGRTGVSKWKSGCEALGLEAAIGTVFCSSADECLPR